MKKMRLELEALEVESFEAGGTVGFGTVHANSAMNGCTAGAGNCYNSVVASCGGSPAQCGADADNNTEGTCGGATNCGVESCVVSCGCNMTIMQCNLNSGPSDYSNCSCPEFSVCKPSVSGYNHCC